MSTDLKSVRELQISIIKKHIENLARQYRDLNEKARVLGRVAVQSEAIEKKLNIIKSRIEKLRKLLQQLVEEKITPEEARRIIEQYRLYEV